MKLLLNLKFRVNTDYLAASNTEFSFSSCKRIVCPNHNKAIRNI